MDNEEIKENVFIRPAWEDDGGAMIDGLYCVEYLYVFEHSRNKERLISCFNTATLDFMIDDIVVIEHDS
jgi:hypothetical protein